jgi:hypothetical protein
VAAFDTDAFDVDAFSADAFDLAETVLVEVPDVVGQSQASGTAELEGEGFAVAVREAYSSTVAAGLIIEQSPAAGADAPEGSTVTITVSLGEQKGGGISRKHRRLFVEIDGQHFPVNSEAEGRQLLEQARAIAERHAEKKSSRIVKKLAKKPQVPRITLAAPVITVSPELQEQASPLIADIQRLYDRAAQAAEIRLLMGKNVPDDDEEDDLLLLL